MVLTRVLKVADGAADLPLVCLLCSLRSLGPRTQRTPVAATPPHSCGAQPLGSACVPWTPSEGSLL